MMNEQRLQGLVRRIHRFSLNLRDTPLVEDILDLREHWDEGLFRELDEEIAELEQAQVMSPFPPVPQGVEVSSGDYRMANTIAGCALSAGTTDDSQEVRLSFLQGRPNRVYHVSIAGNVGSGKSYLQAQIASACTGDCSTFLIDTSRTFSGIECMRQTHKFIRDVDLRLNPWDGVDGFSARTSDSVVNKLIAGHCSLQYGEYELNEACEDLRAAGKTPNLPWMIEHLTRKKYPPGSRRNYYRDSAVLGLKNILGTSGDGRIYACAKGVDVRALLEENTVLLMSGLAQSQAFMSELLLTYVELLVYSGMRLKRPLAFFLDETQILLNAERNRLAAFTLGARHLGIHLIFSFQNASACPPEILSNCDAFFCFKMVDGKDRYVFQRLASLNYEQSAFLAGLQAGESMAFFPKSNWKYPLLCRTMDLAACVLTDRQVESESRANVSRFGWEKIEVSPSVGGVTDGIDSGGTGKKTKGGTAVEGVSLVDKAAEAFMADLLDQKHEFSAAMQRWERAKVRSRSLQDSVLKKLTSEGLIEEDRLPLNLRGPSIVLYRPSEKAFMDHGVQWKSTGRGTLRTRAATHYLMNALVDLERSLGLKAIREGTLNGKQVDILVRHPDGLATCLEIAGESEKHEVHNALHCLGCVEVKKHLVICLGSKVQTAVKRRVREHPALVKDSRLEVVLLAHLLDELKNGKL